MPSPPTIVLYIPGPLLGERLKELLARPPGGSLCQACDRIEQMFAHLEQGQADLLIKDLGRPDEAGLTHLRQLRSRWPGLLVLGLGWFKSPPYAQAALQAGATRYLAKTELERLPALVEALLKSRPLPPDIPLEQ